MIIDEKRNGLVLRVIFLEGAANVLVLGMKAAVGFATGSMAVLADAVHSLTDVTNNIIAWGVTRESHQPADREHPYGHQKFEVPGIIDVPRVRSRRIGPERAVDVIVTVAASLSTIQSHAIADEVETLLETKFDVTDITVHVEPKS